MDKIVNLCLTIVEVYYNILAQFTLYFCRKTESSYKYKRYSYQELEAWKLAEEVSEINPKNKKDKANDLASPI